MNPTAPQDLSAALAATGLLSDPCAAPIAALPAVAGPKPNILFILVDEMRFPSVFPAGINDAGSFLKSYMPNVHGLWEKGVKFSNYHTAASACTPARGTLVTGLYSQQTWMCVTLTGEPTATKSIPPTLRPAFPTYGKLLREAGYQTPYIGKWHLSLKIVNEPGLGLEPFGFTGMVYPDPIGYNLQGTIGNQPNYQNDKDVSNAAVGWLQANAHDTQPWCLSVSFVNPHDKEFFWAGTEYRTFNRLYSNPATNPGGSVPVTYYAESDTGSGAPPVPWFLDVLKDPLDHGYSPLPSNWESAAQLAATKPSTQTTVRAFQDLVWGGCSDNAQQNDFTIEPYPSSAATDRKGIHFGIATAPFSYWARGLDCYTETMHLVDERIGEVLAALPADVADNTIIIFASDHGDYAGAHGLLSGKMGTCYKEAFHVPLVVVDPSKRFTAETHLPRHGLVSSVDMLRFLVSLGYNGGQEWMTGDYAQMYGGRHDLFPMLKSAIARGRHYALLATDELLPDYFNFNGAPIHILGVVTELGKFATYSHWRPGTDMIKRLSVETELYDYTTKAGRAEIQNLSRSPIIPLATSVLLDQLLPNEFHAELPESLQDAQREAKAWYLGYEELMVIVPPSSPTQPNLDSPFGKGF